MKRIRGKLAFSVASSYTSGQEDAMELIINVHVEKLPEGYYLVTSNEIQGLVAQGRTVAEAIEIVRDVARRLLEAQQEHKQSASQPGLDDSFDIPLVVSS
jgi:predicted RNase H-like HicB family nuclease